MDSNPLVRHLFNKLNTEIDICFKEYQIKGILKTIDLYGRYIEVESAGNTHFINLNKCDRIVTQKVILKDNNDKM